MPAFPRAPKRHGKEHETCSPSVFDMQTCLVGVEAGNRSQTPLKDLIPYKAKAPCQTWPLGPDISAWSVYERQQQVRVQVRWCMTSCPLSTLYTSLEYLGPRWKKGIYQIKLVYHEGPKHFSVGSTFPSKRHWCVKFNMPSSLGKSPQNSKSDTGWSRREYGVPFPKAVDIWDISTGMLHSIAMAAVTITSNLVASNNKKSHDFIVL